MPVRRLSCDPNLDHLRYQAKDLLREHAARLPRAAQRIREFHPKFAKASDSEIFDIEMQLSDSRLTTAKEYGFASWTRLKRFVEQPGPSDRLALAHHERIQDSTLKRAVDLVDAGDVTGLSSLLKLHPRLVHQHVLFEGGNYFRNPTLLEFVAENPVRHGTLPANIVQVTRVILDAGPEQSARNETLMLVATGSVPREYHVQLPLIDLLCQDGADPNSALQAALLHAEREAVDALIQRGARVDLPVAAGLGRIDEFRRLLPKANQEKRHLALALASQFGYVEIVRLLLDAGENPNRYNPPGGHSHTTPLHQAAAEGYDQLVRLLVERGARLDWKDVLWHGTPADWARHAGRTEIEEYLRAQGNSGG